VAARVIVLACPLLDQAPLPGDSGDKHPMRHP